jgi:hypothetical protein
LRVYDDEFYKTQFNRKSAEAFLKYVRDVQKIIKKKGWDLETKFNKHYCGFKAGFFNVFGIEWIGSKTFSFFIKLSEEEVKDFIIPMTRYASQWKQANYYIDPEITKADDFIPLFELAYKKRTGE